MKILGLSCCGVAEATGLGLTVQPPEDKLWAFCLSRHFLDPVEGFYYRCRYIMFTQASSPGKDGAITPNQAGYGFEFAEFIRANNLGELIDSIPPGVNPNSHNELKVWMWIPDHAAIRLWLTAEVKRRDYKYVPPSAEPANQQGVLTAGGLGAVGLAQGINQRMYDHYVRVVRRTR